MVEVMMKELSISGSTNLKDSEMFARYFVAQEKKVQASKQAIELRDRHQTFEEREQHLKELKCEDWILSMDLYGMCPKDKARYSAMKEEIRSRYRQSSSSTNLD